MKIRTIKTEIECTAEELRQSNSLADGFANMLRGCFNGVMDYDIDISDYESEVGEDDDT